MRISPKSISVQEFQNQEEPSKSTASTSARKSTSDTMEHVAGRELTTDQLERAKTDTTNTKLSERDAAELKAELESRLHSRVGSSSDSRRQPQNGTKMNPVDSQYSVDTKAPSTFEESKNELGNRADKLKDTARGYNNARQRAMQMGDLINYSKEQGKARQDAAHSGMTNHGDPWKKAADWARKVGEWALDVLGDETKVGPPGGNEVMTILKGPELVQEVTGDSKDLLNGAVAVNSNPWRRDGMPHKFQDQTEDLDPIGPKSGNWGGDDLLPWQMQTGNILTGVTGKGQGGGEVVNPGAEGTQRSGGSKYKTTDAYRYRMEYDNSHVLVGQPNRDNETGSGSIPSGGTKSADEECGNADNRANRTEEPSDVQTGPTGDLSHLAPKA